MRGRSMLLIVVSVMVLIMVSSSMADGSVLEEPIDGPSESDVIMIDGHAVTFDVTRGLGYDVVSVTDGSVSFSVHQSDGWLFEEGTVRVTSSYGTLSEEDGIHTLADITSDVIIRIDGTAMLNVTYSLSHVDVVEHGMDDGGRFVIDLSPWLGWARMDVRVLLNGADVTTQSVSGGHISVNDAEGNLMIVAHSNIPWLWVAIIASTFLALVFILTTHRDRFRDDGNR